MEEKEWTQADRPKRNPEERYRLYIDESGDHVFRQLDQPHHRHLCLLGCLFQGLYYKPFHAALEAFKQRHVPHNPDEPVVLHRQHITNRRGSFWRLRDPKAEQAFNLDLLQLIRESRFLVIVVVIDKKTLIDRYDDSASHPYHLALGFMLQRYCGYLNHISRQDDVMAESRGGREDRLLKQSYAYVYQRGAWGRQADFFQQALTSKELKLKPKSANIAGLQLADLLGHPVKQSILRELRRIPGEPTSFAQTLLAAVEKKFNRHLYEDRVWGCGKVFYPKSPAAGGQ